MWKNIVYACLSHSLSREKKVFELRKITKVKIRKLQIKQKKLQKI